MERATQEPNEAIRSLLARWLQAFVDADVEAMLGLYAADATFTGTSTAGFTRAPEQVRAYFVRVLRERTPRRAEILDSATQVFEGSAVVTALDRIEWSDPGLPQVSMGRVTFVLQHGPQGWRIASFHRSEVPRG